jgi:hypothetical protein
MTYVNTFLKKFFSALSGLSARPVEKYFRPITPVLKIQNVRSF